MPFTWQTTVTDRTSDSYYNASDTERVNNNNEYLKEYANDYLDIAVTLLGYTTKTKSSLPRNGTINRLEGSINALKDTVVGTDPLNWITLDENWQGDSYGFLYTNANNLEVNQANLFEVFIKIYESQRYCNNYNCGETWGELFSSVGIQ